MINAIEALEERRKRSLLRISPSDQYRSHLNSMKSNVAIVRDVYISTNEPAQLNPFEFRIKQADLLPNGVSVIIKGVSSTNLPYDILRNKTKSDERARYAFICEQINEKLLSRDWAFHKNSPDLLFNSTNEIGRPTKYIPSDELVNIVRNSILRKQSELESIAAEGRVVPDEESSPFRFANDHERPQDSKEVIRNFISNSVDGFLATIGQGLAYGDGETAVLSKNGELLDFVLAGFRHRIPVMLKDAGHFSIQLYKDLFKAAYNNLLNSEFGELILQDNTLVVKRIKTITPASERLKGRTRAKINRIG